MQLAIWPTPPALMLVAYRFSKLFADRFCAIGASNQTHFMTPPDPPPPPPPPLLVIRGFSLWLIGWWGLRLPFSSECRPEFEWLFGSWFWGELQCICWQGLYLVLYLAAEKDEENYCHAAQFFFSVTYFDLSSIFMPVKFFIKRHLRTWGVKSKWSLRRLQRYTTWPDVRFVQAILLDVSGRRQNCECVLAN